MTVLNQNDVNLPSKQELFTFKTSTIMAQTSMTVRIDNQQKAMFDQLCEQFGMSANTAINVFVRQVIRLRRIPFTIAAAEPIDDDIRTKAIKAIQDIREDAGNRPELTLEVINAEINAIRETRQKTL